MNDGGFALEMAMIMLLIVSIIILVTLLYGISRLLKWIYAKRKAK
mgnify:CR=1 FL=1